MVVTAAITVAVVASRALAGGTDRAVVAAGLLAPASAVVSVWLTRRLLCRGAEPSVTVRRFRVQLVSGMMKAYMFKGELPPDALRTGDLVRVEGWRMRHGDTVVRSIDILATLAGPVIRAVVGRQSAAVVAARWLNGLCIALAVLMLIGVAFVVGVTV
jgi:hypothetical protein